MGTKNDISSFFSGFFVGALIGGATALFLAPQSGEETRTQLRERGIELRDRAEATYTDVLQRVEATTEEISAKVDEAIAQGRQEIAKMRKQVEQGAPEAAEEASDES